MQKRKSIVISSLILLVSASSIFAGAKIKLETTELSFTTKEHFQAGLEISGYNGG